MNEIDETIDDIESFQEVDSLERGLASGKKYTMETDPEVCQRYREEAQIGRCKLSEEKMKEKMKEILSGPLTDEILQKYGWGILCGEDDDF